MFQTCFIFHFILYGMSYFPIDYFFFQDGCCTTNQFRSKKDQLSWFNKINLGMKTLHLNLGCLESPHQNHLAVLMGELMLLGYPSSRNTERDPWVVELSKTLTLCRYTPNFSSSRSVKKILKLHMSHTVIKCRKNV